MDSATLEKIKKCRVNPADFILGSGTSFREPVRSMSLSREKRLSTLSSRYGAQVRTVVNEGNRGECESPCAHYLVERRDLRDVENHRQYFECKHCGYSCWLPSSLFGDIGSWS